MTEINPETLDKLRRGFPLRMDRMGNFFLARDAITHPGVVAAFRRGLDLSDAGEPIVRVGEQWTYVEVADCVLRVVRVVAGEDGRPQLVLDDGRTVALDPAELWEEPDRGLRCTVPAAGSQRPLSTRFGNTAQMDLDHWLVWPEGPENEHARPRLRLDGDHGVEREIPNLRPVAHA